MQQWCLTGSHIGNLSLRISSTRWIAANEDELRAALRQLTSGFQTQTAAGSGDEDDFVFHSLAKRMPPGPREDC